MEGAVTRLKAKYPKEIEQMSEQAKLDITTILFNDLKISVSGTAVEQGINNGIELLKQSFAAEMKQYQFDFDGLVVGMRQALDNVR